MPGRHAVSAWTRTITIGLALFALAVAFATPARADTVVSLTFDAGEASQAQVKDVLASRGMRATFFVNSGKVGTGGFYMTWPQLDALAAAGHEIGGRTLANVSLMDPAVPEAEKRKQVCEDRQNLIARGYDPVSFAYPGGWGDAVAESIVSDCGYRAGRRVGGIVSPNWCPSCGSPRAETLPPEDPFMVRTPAFGSGEITLGAVQDAVMQAELAGGWLPIVFHGVCEEACGGGWVKPATLEALIDWLAARNAQGTVVRPIREALGLGAPPPTPPDTTAPETSIVSGPSGSTKSRAASFEFSSSETGASFECKLDAGAWAACGSPTDYSALANGSHTVSVRAKDAAGNVDPSPATRTWIVDAQTVVTFTFDDGDATQYVVKDILASRGMRATFFVNSPRIGTSSAYMTWAQLDALAADGNEIAGHTLTHADLTNPALSDAQKRAEVCDDRQNLVARGYDPVSFAYPLGASDANVQSIVGDCGYLLGRRVGGIVSPNWCPACASPNAESLPPENPLLVRTPSFGNGEITLTAIQAVVTQAETTGGWVPLVFHGVCESGPCGDGWLRPSTLSALLDWLSARSANGTVVQTMRKAFTGQDHILPTALDTSIVSGPSGTVASRSASFGFGGNRSGLSFQCKLDWGSWSSCTSPKAYSSLSNGTHTFSVRAKDSSGRVDTTPATRTWKVDTAAPNTWITSAPSSWTGLSTATFRFSGSESGSTFECKLDSGTWSACTSPKTYSVGYGTHTFSVRAKDGAGNVDPTPATYSWRRR